MNTGVVFYITIRYTGSSLRLRAKKIFQNTTHEQFEIVAKNKTLIIRGDSPLLRNRGLKYKRINWHLVEGQLANSYVLEQIIKQLDKHIRELENET